MDAISNCSITIKRVRENLDRCQMKNELTDTFTIDHLLSKLNSNATQVLSCISPIDGIGLPYFEKYLKPQQKAGKTYLLIPLCDGVHFQGYIVDIKKSKVIHVDSLRWDAAENATAIKIAQVLFGDSNASYESFYQSRMQFDTNSCGIWLVAGMCSFVIGLPEVIDRDNAFDICFSLLEQNKEHQISKPIAINDVNVLSEFCNEEQVKKFNSADFIIQVLRNNPEKSEYYRESPPKGIRTNSFFICDISKTNLADVTADDNGAYIKTRNTTKIYFCDNDQIIGARGEQGGFYYNKRVSFSSYLKIFVSDDKVVSFHRSYSKAKSFPLSRTVITISDPVNGPISPYVAVTYQTEGPIPENVNVLSHGNTKRSTKPYLKTSRNVLEKTKASLEKGMSSKKVYDQINNTSGGVFFSTSQSNELRDTRQVYRQSAKLKEKEKNTNESINDQLASLLNLQRTDADFLRTVTCLRNSYYVFLGTDIQLNDVSKFCCDMNEVLGIDTTFNLCESWLTDTCYKNHRLETAEGKQPVFIGPCIIHFEKDEFIFNRFITEMCSYQPSIRMLKTIGTDLEKAIYNGFASQIKDLRLLLCVFHLQKSDKRKLLQLNPQKGASKKIIADIYGCQYGGIKEYGLADSENSTDFQNKLKELKFRWETLCPGFYEWFVQKRSKTFESSVIESARHDTNIQGLFYNNNIESQHFREKKEQCFQTKTVNDVVDTLKSLVLRQQDDEVRAIYGSGPYHLSKSFKKFEIDSLKWHSMDSKQRIKHVNSFRSYRPNLEDNFSRPASSGRKPSQKNRIRNPEPEIIINRMSKKSRSSSLHLKVEDPNVERALVYELHLRSQVPRIVERCQGNCGIKLIPADENDYLLVKSYGPSTYTVKGECKTKYGPQYIHFKGECLKEYAHRKHEKVYNIFPFELITTDNVTSSSLNESSKNELRGYGLNI